MRQSPFMFRSAVAILTIVCAQLPAQIVINELNYDDSGTDDLEFVELYNAGLPGGPTVDISNWVLASNDPSGANASFTVPAGTMLAAGAYWVMGSALVPNVNQVVGVSNIWENDNETLELRDSTGLLIDSVLYEASKGVSFAPADVQSSIGKGAWGNYTLIEATSTTDNTRLSISRRLNGVDTNDNGRNFGMRFWTPGADNLGTGSIITQYSPPNVDSGTPGDAVAGLIGTFRNARVIDPMDTSTLVGTLVLNPNAIPPSPQGGNAIISWDPSGGGNSAVSNDLFNGDGSFEIYAYLDTSSITVPGAESTMYGIMGSNDTFNNFPDPDANFLGDIVTANGATGLAWVFNKDNANDNRKLFLVDAGGGGDSSPGVMTPADWTILQTIDMSNVASGWYRLGIDYDAASGNVTAVFGNQVFNFTSAPGLTGEFYVGYRESLAGTPSTLRPATFDLVPEPTVSILAALALVLLQIRRR